MTVEAREIAPVRKEVVVQANVEVAFDAFTASMGDWWPRERYTIGNAPMRTVVVEPRAGGRWFELGLDGSECDWGRVLSWEPPSRVLLSWQIDANWKHDPDLTTEVEVTFHEEEYGRTRVRLEHRRLEAYGEAAAQMQAKFASESGWSLLLVSFAASVAGRAPH